jgi:hypothetical protein
MNKKKQFFFEKKNQKTFVNLVLGVSGATGPKELKVSCFAARVGFFSKKKFF